MEEETKNQKCSDCFYWHRIYKICTNSDSAPDDPDGWCSEWEEDR